MSPPAQNCEEERRILLIDDEAASRLVMHNRVRDLGNEVVVADNGAGPARGA